MRQVLKFASRAMKVGKEIQLLDVGYNVGDTGNEEWNKNCDWKKGG